VGDERRSRWYLSPVEIDTDIYEILSVEPFDDFEFQERVIEWDSPEHKKLLRVEEEARVRYRTSKESEEERKRCEAVDPSKPRSDWKVARREPPYRLRVIKW